MIAGSALRDLTDEWSRLDRKIRITITLIPILVGLFAIYLLYYVLFNRGGGSVLLSAESEYVEFTALSDDPSILLLPKADVLWTTAKEKAEEDLFSEDNKTSNVLSRNPIQSSPSFLELACGDEVVFSRVGRGPLRLHVSRLKDDGPRFIDSFDNYLELDNLPKDFSIEITDTDKYFEEGQSLSWQISGLIVVGRPVEISTSVDRGLLVGGQIDVYAENIVGSDYYRAEQFELGVGDQVVLPSAKKHAETKAKLLDVGNDEETLKNICSRNDVRDKGFIHLRDKAAMNVSVSSKSHYAIVERFQVATLEVKNSWIKRILNDKLFSLLWTFIITFFVFYRRLVRSYLAVSIPQE